MSILSDEEKRALRNALLQWELHKTESSEEEASGQEEAIVDLPDDETLIRFADGTIRGKSRERIEAAATQSFLGTLVLSDWEKEYEAVRNLENDMRGWKGPWLSSWGILPADVSVEDWEAHLRRCRRARIKEYMLLPIVWIRSTPSGSHSPTVRPHRYYILLGALIVTFLYILSKPPTSRRNDTDVVTGRSGNLDSEGRPIRSSGSVTRNTAPTPAPPSRKTDAPKTVPSGPDAQIPLNKGGLAGSKNIAQSGGVLADGGGSLATGAVPERGGSGSLATEIAGIGGGHGSTSRGRGTRASEGGTKVALNNDGLSGGSLADNGGSLGTGTMRERGGGRKSGYDPSAGSNIDLNSDGSTKGAKGPKGGGNLAQKLGGGDLGSMAEGSRRSGSATGDEGDIAAAARANFQRTGSGSGVHGETVIARGGSSNGLKGSEASVGDSGEPGVGGGQLSNNDKGGRSENNGELADGGNAGRTPRMNRDTRPISDPMPRLTDEMKQRKPKSRITVSVEVNVDGSHSEEIVTGSGDDEVNALILKTMKRWKWSPAILDGTPTKQKIKYRFTLSVK